MSTNADIQFPPTPKLKPCQTRPYNVSLRPALLPSAHPTREAHDQVLFKVTKKLNLRQSSHNPGHNQASRRRLSKAFQFVGMDRTAARAIYNTFPIFSKARQQFALRHKI